MQATARFQNARESFNVIDNSLVIVCFVCTEWVGHGSGGCLSEEVELDNVNAVL
jgi:hypothetical protein